MRCRIAGSFPLLPCAQSLIALDGRPAVPNAPRHSDIDTPTVWIAPFPCRRPVGDGRTSAPGAAARG
jgi:hypothetical protein